MWFKQIGELPAMCSIVRGSHIMTTELIISISFGSAKQVDFRTTPTPKPSLPYKQHKYAPTCASQSSGRSIGFGLSETLCVWHIRRTNSNARKNAVNTIETLVFMHTRAQNTYVQSHSEIYVFVRLGPVVVLGAATVAVVRSDAGRLGNCYSIREANYICHANFVRFLGSGSARTLPRQEFLHAFAAEDDDDCGVMGDIGNTGGNVIRDPWNGIPANIYRICTTFYSIE